jgi:hypothetical protein
MVLERPSLSDGSTESATSDNKRGASVRKPVKTTRSAIPS